MNLPNKLTLLRLILVPFFIAFTIQDNIYTRILAFLIFAAGGLTDIYDGYVARKYGQVTTLGIFLDPLADKLLISAAFISFVSLSEINVPAWMVVFIIGREFLITGLRSLAASQGRVLPAEGAGKFKTTSQVVSILVIVLILIVNSVLERWGDPREPGALLERSDWKATLGWLLQVTPYWLTFLTMVLTLISGFTYISRNRDLFHHSKAQAL